MTSPALPPSINSPADFLNQLTAGILSEEDIRQVLLTLSAEHLQETVMQAWISSLLELAPTVPTLDMPVMDCCGTGGSGLSHFNTSTITAFVLAAGGVPIVKFGNRGIQQAHGSFDFLGGLGFEAPIQLTNVPQLIECSNLAFVFAPQCYPQLAPVHQVRKTLDTATLFHFIGPLLNPFLPAYRLLGVSNINIIPFAAKILQDSPHHRNSWIVNTQLQPQSITGLDELAPIGQTYLTAVSNQGIKTLINPSPIPQEKLDPLPHYQKFMAQISVQDSLRIFKRLLTEKLQPLDLFSQEGFCQELVLLNAASGFIIAGKAKRFEEGKQLAAELLESGRVAETLKKYQEAYDACK